MSKHPGEGRSPAPTIGSAPRAAARAVVAGRSPEPAPSSPASELVESLVRIFAEQLERSLKVSLDGSVESLAFVDHYLSLARDEVREPIVSLLAAGAGAYFGELVRRRIGGTWVGDGKDPRRLRLLVEPQFVHFSPIDQAYEAIAGTELDPEDDRIAAGPGFDSSFGLRPPPPEPDEDDFDAAPTEAGTDEPLDDTTWLQQRLSELSPVPEDQFYSLTCRFETLELMLELLAVKHVGEGRSPQRYGLSDYVQVLARHRA